MAHFEIDTRIPRSAPQVFAFLTDPTNADRVMADVVAVELVTERVDRVGGQWKETRRHKGKDHTQLLEVSAHEAPTTYAVSTRAEGFDITYRFTLTPESGDTHVTMRCEVAASGMRKLGTHLVVMALKKQDGDHLERLAAAMV